MLSSWLMALLLQVGHPSSLLKLLKKLVLERNLPLNLVAKFFTLNPSNILKLHQKGRVSALASPLFQVTRLQLLKIMCQELTALTGTSHSI